VTDVWDIDSIASNGKIYHNGCYIFTLYIKLCLVQLEVQPTSGCRCTGCVTGLVGAGVGLQAVMLHGAGGNNGGVAGIGGAGGGAGDVCGAAGDNGAGEADGIDKSESLLGDILQPSS
jgi:hypothetical protein